MRVSHDLCTTPNTNWSRDHLECDHNTQDLSSVGTDLVELHDRPRSVGRTEVFMECDWGFSCLPMVCMCLDPYETPKSSTSKDLSTPFLIQLVMLLIFIINTVTDERLP